MITRLDYHRRPVELKSMIDAELEDKSRSAGHNDLYNYRKNRMKLPYQVFYKVNKRWDLVQRSYIVKCAIYAYRTMCAITDPAVKDLFYQLYSPIAEVAKKFLTDNHKGRTLPKILLEDFDINIYQMSFRSAKWKSLRFALDNCGLRRISPYGFIQNAAPAVNKTRLYADVTAEGEVDIPLEVSEAFDAQPKETYNALKMFAALQFMYNCATLDDWPLEDFKGLWEFIKSQGNTSALSGVTAYLDDYTRSHLHRRTMQGHSKNTGASVLVYIMHHRQSLNPGCEDKLCNIENLLKSAHIFSDALGDVPNNHFAKKLETLVGDPSECLNIDVRTARVLLDRNITLEQFRSMPESVQAKLKEQVLTTDRVSMRDLLGTGLVSFGGYPVIHTRRLHAEIATEFIPELKAFAERYDDAAYRLESALEYHNGNIYRAVLDVTGEPIVKQKRPSLLDGLNYAGNPKVSEVCQYCNTAFHISMSEAMWYISKLAGEWGGTMSEWVNCQSVESAAEAVKNCCRKN